MNLNSKYLGGLSVLIVVSLGTFFSYIFFDLEEYVSIRLLVLGIFTTIVGIVFVALLFSPERIKGYRAEYEASPDLTSFKVVKTFTEHGQKQAEIPEVAFCSTCGKKIYRPFYCSRCGQLLCGEHYLLGSHLCKE
ncbi:MAG: AN1-type zinc finger domain-containing protein [Candidatus Heimdallarchaeota archaeon]|nr:MAG: AN1-type zinc finger domain-containing protein [Candidatus Heimdallarchaeota archaeon]